jgi:hypothetical protein
VAAVHRGSVIACGQPALSSLPRGEVHGAPGPPILLRAQPGSTALLKTFGQRRASANASATR